MVKCNACVAGAQVFTTANAIGFTYADSTTGIGCPVDGSYHAASCTKMKFDATKKIYVCDCVSLTTKALATFKTTSTQPISQACIANNDAS